MELEKRRWNKRMTKIDAYLPEDQPRSDEVTLSQSHVWRGALRHRWGAESRCADELPRRAEHRSNLDINIRGMTEDSLSKTIGEPRK